ncbi:fatty acid desaturase [Oceanibium sediminis]|uniref:fatty acid desaturase n=1 Tax=Oceanibium sediminis TaxID=2026339 RepID=UPI0018E4E994|nr:fatty acid desaturase [Oceanibium sediminis]
MQDYVLSGEGRPKPVKWWAPSLPSVELARLRTLSDHPATGNFALWVALLLASGAVAFALYPSVWAIPAFFIYGTIYSSSDARWHELSHGTVFASPRLNRFWYEICSFMTIREAYLWRYSHTRHHTHTIVRGADPEIQVTRPAHLLHLLMDVFHLRGGTAEIRRILRHAFIGLAPAEASFVPERARARLVRSSRIYVALWALLILACVTWRTPLPLLFVIGPRFYAGWLHQLLGLTQHAGLAENVSDHRLNTRTVLVNPVFRFLYMNMNYHLEHHVSPTVPYHALPALHAAIRDECPPPYPGVWAVYREMLPVLWRQAFGELEAQVARPLPG